MLTIPKQFFKISIKDLILCMQSFTLFKVNTCIFSIIQFHLAFTKQLYEEKLPFLSNEHSHKNNLNFQGLKVITFSKTWQILENGLITILWL